MVLYEKIIHVNFFFHGGSAHSVWLAVEETVDSEIYCSIISQFILLSRCHTTSATKHLLTCRNTFCPCDIRICANSFEYCSLVFLILFANCFSLMGRLLMGTAKNICERSRLGIFTYSHTSVRTFRCARVNPVLLEPDECSCTF